MGPNGAQCLAGLREGRAIYIDGECVSDVTDHPAFLRGLASAGCCHRIRDHPVQAAFLFFVTHCMLYVFAFAGTRRMFE